LGLKGTTMSEKSEKAIDRRAFLKGAGAATASLALGSCGFAGKLVQNDSFSKFFQSNLREMTPEEYENVKKRLLKQYKKKYGREFVLGNEPPDPNVLFGYGLDLGRCIGCRRCVYACVAENNQSRNPQIQWIRVLEFKREDVIRRINLEEGNPSYDHGLQPEEGMVYMPISCQQCENPECVRACPTQATWKEPDGIVVIDYDWCIGCRYCMSACPYGSRSFNWADPEVPSEEINPKIHVLGNRPRERGVVEKCTFCIHRTRKGRYPACVEACPVGARKFGNLLDPDSEISLLIKHKRTFVLKAEIGTNPKFFYFYSFYG
jgi:Fe-S-cluster-containing dehydrogenase component